MHGPILRHVSGTTATIWVETDSACTVRVRDACGGAAASGQADLRTVISEQLA
jgi:hypothetical protein